MFDSVVHIPPKCSLLLSLASSLTNTIWFIIQSIFWVSQNSSQLTLAWKAGKSSLTGADWNLNLHSINYIHSTINYVFKIVPNTKFLMTKIRALPHEVLHLNISGNEKFMLFRFCSISTATLITFVISLSVWIFDYPNIIEISDVLISAS